MFQKPRKIKVKNVRVDNESPFVPVGPVDAMQELKDLCNKYRLTVVKEYDESDNTIRLMVQKRTSGSHVAQTGWFDHESEIPAKAQTLVPKVLEYARSYGLTISRETLI